MLPKRIPSQLSVAFCSVRVPPSAIVKVSTPVYGHFPIIEGFADFNIFSDKASDSSNMCPSKAIDFVSSGKPILHISKIPNCCAKKYLEKYPNKYCIYQNVELTPEIINEVEQFVFSSKGKERIPYCKVEELYSDFTMDALINKILYVFNEL